ncbi:TonB-dependent receptor domain-containing protein [Acinetobacter pseudolwoffii]|uniref:TonB-dependent receptor domain-containing protein n=1 Tax=Acinetobacter pseudolwoffii TaxID=2053287 RepID=UPI0009444482|nr:TonB-dependent receptor [Acinetobacter pseudolwoffii]
MRDFNLRPLAVAILGVTTTSVFAETNSTSNVPTTTLSTIVVSAAGFEQDIKNAPASISVVTKEDIEKKNATSIADLLADVPGIDVRNGVGKTGGLNVSMRGMKAEDTLILIDGRRQTTATDNIMPNGFSEASTSFMPPLSAIERIEVIRGPMSTLYGSDAMGGVINIITKKVSDVWNGNVTVSGNVMDSSKEADSWKTSFLVNGPIVNDKLGLQLRGSYYDRGESERINNGTSRDPRPTTAENYDVGAKLSFQADNQNALWLDGFQSVQTYDNADNRLGTQDTPAKASGYKNELEFTRNQIAIGHDGDYDFGIWNTYISHTETETDGRTLPTEAFEKGSTSPLIGSDRTLKSTDLVADSHIVSQLGNHKVTGGLEFKKQTIEDNIARHITGKDKFDKDSWSIYAEDEWKIADSLGLTFGGRYEDHSGFGGHFSPRAYLVWNTNDILTIKGGITTGYKAPSAKDLENGLVDMSGQGKTYVFGNPNLKPETSTNYELGFNLQPTDKINFTTTAFYNQIEDAIISKDISDQAICPVEECSQDINAQEAKVYGAEASLQYAILPEWDIKASYTYTKSEVTDGGNEGLYYNNNPRDAFNLTSTWHINPDLDIWLQHEYKSSRTRFTSLPTSGDNLEVYKMYGNKFAGYNLFNLGTSYSVNEQVRVNMAVNNLLDKDFTEHQTVNGVTGYKYLSTGRSTSGTYLPGRNYWLSVSYDF